MAQHHEAARLQSPPRVTMLPNEGARDLQHEDHMVAAALAAAGVQVHSVYDLVNARHPYPAAIPVLLALLPHVQHPRIKEGIARALTVREARPAAAQPLLAAFIASQPQSKSDEHAKWALANALAVVADDAIYAQLVPVLRERTHGWPRSGMVAALTNMPQHQHEAVDVLCALLADADVAPQALTTLGNLRDPRARSAIEPFLRHPDAWVRHQAKRAWAKIAQAGKPSSPCSPARAPRCAE